MNSNKHALWQAFVVALVIFIVGIGLGFLFEQTRVDRFEEFYTNTEMDIMDVELETDLLELFDFDCDLAKSENIFFADKIYGEAILLAKYDDSNKIINDLIVIHKRYDLLHVLLWKNAIKIRNRCGGEINVVVYLYDYIDTPLDIEAKQLAFSSVLSELKGKRGDDVILIPLAYDTGVRSLEILKSEYELDSFPVVLVNGVKVTEVSSVTELEKIIFNTNN